MFSEVSDTWLKMRISFFLGGLRAGGAERQMVYLIRELSKRGVKCQLLTFYKGDHYRELLDQTSAEVRLVERASRNYLRFLWDLRTQVRKFQPELLQAFMPTPNLAAILVGLSIDRPVFLGERSNQFNLSWRRRLPRVVLYPKAYCVIANASVIARNAGSFYHLNPAKLAVIPNGIEAAQWNCPRDAQADPNTVLTIASVKPEKGLETLLAAAPLVSNQHPGVHFVIVGGGRRLEQLESEVRRLGLQQYVHTTGVVQDVKAQYQRADVFCLPSRSEGMPNALMEAMAAGLPAVATQVGGVPDLLLHQRTGLLVPADQPEPLAEALIRLLGDAQLRQSFSEAARQHIQQFSIDRMADRYLELWRRAI